MFKIGQKGVIVANKAHHSFSTGEMVCVENILNSSNNAHQIRGGCYWCKSLTTGIHWYVFGTDMKLFNEDFKLEDFL